MRVRFLLTFMAAGVLVTAASAQQPQSAPVRPRTSSAATSDQTPATAPAPPPTGAGARRQGQPVNIKVDFTITDQRGSGTPIKRTLSVIVADSHTGMVRSQAEVAQVGTVPLNIDTSPEILSDGKIRLGFNVQYDWPVPIDAATPRDGAPNAPPARGTVFRTTIHDSVSLILESGKPMVAAQSADPIGDRQVTVEVKATVLK
jgi:hypothetical protein